MGILNQCLILFRTEESAFLHDFYYLVEDRIDLLLPLAVGTQIRVLCRWAARADRCSVWSPEQDPPPSHKEKTV